MRPSPGSIQSGMGIGMPHCAQGFCMGISPMSGLAMAPLPFSFCALLFDFWPEGE
jgi:hypothetical protein